MISRGAIASSPVMTSPKNIMNVFSAAACSSSVNVALQSEISAASMSDEPWMKALYLTFLTRRSAQRASRAGNSLKPSEASSRPASRWRCRSGVSISV